MSASRTIFSRALGAAVTLITFVLVGEAVLALLGVSYPPRHKRDHLLGILQRPGVKYHSYGEGEADVQINSEGFRDVEWPLEKPADEVRIAVLGDSFIEAIQVPIDQRVTELLASDLAERPQFAGTKVRVMNLGMSGFGTGQELLSLTDRAAKYHPDYVVLCVLTANDFTENYLPLDRQFPRPYFQLNAEGGVTLDDSRAKRMSWRDLFVEGVMAHSRLLQVALEGRHRFRGMRSAEPITQKKSDVIVADAVLDEEIYAPPSTPAWRTAWDITEHLLSATNDAAHQLGAELLVVTLSNPEQVRPERAMREAYMRNLGVSDLNYADDRIAVYCQTHDIPVLNLAPPLLAYAEANNIYLHGFPGPRLGMGHWNSVGHRLAAELIAERLTQMRAEQNDHGSHDSESAVPRDTVNSP